MGHFEDLEDLGLKTSVSVLGIRPGLRSELKTLDRLAPAQVVRVYKSLFTERRGGSTYQFRQTVNQPDTNRQRNGRKDGRTRKSRCPASGEKVRLQFAAAAAVFLWPKRNFERDKKSAGNPSERAERSRRRPRLEVCDQIQSVNKFTFITRRWRRRRGGEERRVCKPNRSTRLLF